MTYQRCIKHISDGLNLCNTTDLWTDVFYLYQMLNIIPVCNTFMTLYSSKWINCFYNDICLFDTRYYSTSRPNNCSPNSAAYGDTLLTILSISLRPSLWYWWSDLHLCLSARGSSVYWQRSGAKGSVQRSLRTCTTKTRYVRKSCTWHKNVSPNTKFVVIPPRWLIRCVSRNVLFETFTCYAAWGLSRIGMSNAAFRIANSVHLTLYHRVQLNLVPALNHVNLKAKEVFIQCDVI